MGGERCSFGGHCKTTLFMKRTHLIIFLLFGFLSCQSNNKKETIKEKEIKSKFPTLLNINKNDFHTFSSENETWLSTAYYNFFYIGKLMDTISLEKSIYFNIPPPSKNRKDKFKEFKNPYQKYYIEWDKNNHHAYCLDTLIEVQPKISAIAKKSFAVLLRNINRDTVTIGYGSNIPLIMETKDSLGVWKPIQEKFTYMCGNGVGSIILPPNEIVITFAPIFEGNYKTLLRLTLGKNKSKPYWGFINYRQFKSKFTEYGDYQEEYKKEELNKKQRTTQ